MGGIISLPITLLAAISRKGISYCFNYAAFYVYLTVRNICWKKRFDLYDFEAVGQPKLNGFLIPKIEWILDPPSKTFSPKKNPDDAFIYGTNSKSEYLAVYIRRLPDNRVHCSLFLRMTDGKSYSLLKEHGVQIATSEDNAFGSSRLKLQCLMPMRKWRIFFNGVLEEQTAENFKSYKHMKFSFIWTASSEIFDFSSDLPNAIFSHVAASVSWLKSPTSFIQKMKQTFDVYEQPGMILGTITIEDEPEKELYLWGGRQKFMGKNDLFKQDKCTEVYGTFRNGMQIHWVALNSSEEVKRLCYGYVMQTNGFIFPIEEFQGGIDEVENGKMNIKCYANKKWYNVRINSIGHSDIKFLKEEGIEFVIQTAEMTMDEQLGRGFILKADDLSQSQPFIDGRHSRQSISDSITQSTNNSLTLCLPFDDMFSRRSGLSGGKGSSLGHLYGLSIMSIDDGLNERFRVPKGLIVSTESYKEFIKGSLEKALENFEKDIWSGKYDTMTLCQNMVQVVGNEKLPDHISNTIVDSLRAVFGENISDYKFAVRSSGTGEDTEQMSAAGQMETYLAVKGVDEVLDAVKKCWASQFSFQAVEYKRGYGQHINTPMAVVIQEMVSCEVAGVLFTCDPLTGNPSFISITANYGLGESVVSASADPDTIIISRSTDNNMSIHSKQVGNKKTKIIMDGESGTKEIEIDDSDTSRFCINDNMALKLGKIAVEVEEYYGSPRDIEWGIAEDNIFLFQSRPVTSLDMETDFEIKHAFDTFQRTEKSFWSKANVGEVLPGATSPLSLDLLHRVFDIVYRRGPIKLDEGMHPQKPYFQKSLTYAFGQVFINLLSGQFRVLEDEEQTKGFMISLFGRLLPDEIGLVDEAALVPPPPIPLLKKMALIVHFFYLSFFSGIILRRGTKEIVAFSIPFEGLNSSEILQKIALNYDSTIQAMSLHLNCTYSSSLWNMSMLSLLAKARGDWDNVAFSDFAYLLSTCDGVESATIPAAIEDIGNSVSKEIDVDVFKSMSVTEALDWLNNNLAEAGIKFREFLKRHGHRCLKEFDVYTETWGSNATPVVKMLQKFVTKNAVNSVVKEIDSFSTVLSKLQVQLSFKDRLSLRWLLPNCRRGVRERENAKSLYVLSNNVLRKSFHGLAEAMVVEGRLPRKELLFFLCVDEIQQLMRTRSPKLITKAMRRYKRHKELDGLKFAEICDGIPKPINDKDDIPLTGKGLKMTGVPVSRGIIKAPARVIMNLDEAKAIQQGDILITYSTDIGWSPYFPLLSGIVTEIGGLISHGAVVAREYGLPCVVGLHGAPRAFKSGDLVILDGNKGTLQKAEQE